MLILADENIPFVREACAGLGEVRTIAGRAIGPAALGEAEALLVRSVTQINAALLSGSRVRFVGSATAGVDHVDEPALASLGIAFASAPGSNAESVAQYIAAVLFHFEGKLGRPLAGASIGIAGLGHCGSRVARIARGLGMRVLACDPPLARAGAGLGETFHPLGELASCDFVSLHTPLTHAGPDPTFGMIGADFIARMKPGAVFINAARGGIADEAALIRARREGKLAGLTLDAWAGEPAISEELLRAADIATPHIAGYSLDGKLRGTEMVAAALAQHAGAEMKWRPSNSIPAEIERTPIPPEGIAGLVKHAYPLLRDDAALRETLGLPKAERADAFDRLRKNYPVRREFAATRVTLGASDAGIGPVLEALGFMAKGAPE